MCSERTDLSAEASPRSASRAFDRRDFLKLSGAGLLGVVLLGSCGLGKAGCVSLRMVRDTDKSPAHCGA
jgi:hypothetical protein